MHLTTPATGGDIQHGFYAAYSEQKELLFKQQAQANFFIEGAGGGLTIAPNGNIGIDLSNPHAKLDVNGSFNATSANIAGTIWLVME